MPPKPNRAAMIVLAAKSISAVRSTTAMVLVPEEERRCAVRVVGGPVAVWSTKTAESRISESEMRVVLRQKMFGSRALGRRVRREESS